MKPLEMEERMPVVDLAKCDGLASLTAPAPLDIATWKDPGLPAMPVVTARPAVVAGVPLR